MSNPSPTERIAVELLGWNLHPPQWPHNKALTWYRNKLPAFFGEVFVGLDSEGRAVGGQPTTWPDLTTPDGCREFEGAFAKLGMIGAYAYALMDETVERDEYGVHGPARWDEDHWGRFMLATPAQRVAACLRVLDEVKR